MSKTTLNPPNLFPSLQYGFSQIVVAQGSKTVYLSGQVAWSEAETIIGPDDLGIQTRETLKNVQKAMLTAGGTLQDVVSLRIYFVHHKRNDLPHISAGLKEFFSPETAPAATWIGVESLADPAFLVEIEAIAVLT